MGAENGSGERHAIDEWSVEDSQLLLSMSLCSLIWLSIDIHEPMLFKFLSSVLMTVILVYSAKNESKSTIPNLFIFGLCLRLYFQSFSGFEKVPWSDAIIDVFVSRSLLDYGEITVFSMSSFTSRLEFYSSWPIIHIFIASVSSITGTQVTIGAHISQVLIYFATFMLSIGLVDLLKKKLLLTEKEVVFSVVLLVTLPELIYWQSEAVRQNFGILFHVFAILLLIKMEERRNRIEFSVLLIFCSIFLSIAHHLTSATSVLLIFTVLSCRVILIRVHEQEYSGNDARHILNCFLMISVMTILWWSLVGGILYPVVESVIERYIMIFNGARFTDSLHDPIAEDLPSKLTPFFSIVMIRLRDLLLFGLTGIGFILLFREKGSQLDKIVAYVPLVAAYGLLFSFFFFWAEPFRVVTLAAPVMAISFGYGIVRLTSRMPILRSGSLTLILLASLVSPWAHNYAPAHLYDGDPTSTTLYGETGFHTQDYLEFLFAHSSSDSTIESDFPEEVLYAADADLLNKLGLIGMKEDTENGGISYEPYSDIVVLLRNGSLYSYYSSIYGRVDDFEQGLDWQEEIKKTLSNHNKVYDAGEGVSFWFIIERGAE